MSKVDHIYNRNKEFAKTLSFFKRWVKQPDTITHCRKYGPTEKKIAKNVYDFVGSLQKNKSIDSEERINELEIYILQLLEEYRVNEKYWSDTSYLEGLLSIINHAKKDIDNERPVQTRRK